MDAIKLFPSDSDECKRLVQASKMLTIASENGSVYKVEDIYFDMGQNWWWTTIICYAKDGSSFQALSPKEQEDLLFADNIFDGLNKVVNGYGWTHYCIEKR